MDYLLNPLSFHIISFLDSFIHGLEDALYIDAQVVLADTLFLMALYFFAQAFL
jgi:hypothetical protein